MLVERPLHARCLTQRMDNRKRGAAAFLDSIHHARRHFLFHDEVTLDWPPFETTERFLLGAVSDILKVDRLSQEASGSASFNALTIENVDSSWRSALMELTSRQRPSQEGQRSAGAA